MKAKVIATGEVVNVLLTKQSEESGTNVYQEIGTTKNCSVRRKFLDSELEFIGDFSSNTYTQPKKIDWEQRRYELAKEALNGMLAHSRNGHGYHPRNPQMNWHDAIAEEALEIADAVIAKLKEG